MSTLTLMFCGPHATRGWSPLYHRIDAAIEAARETDSPLLIAGDAYEGAAVRHFADRARPYVAAALEAYDPGSRTITDARIALRLIAERDDLSSVAEVLVVTDDWHVRRCLAYLRGEADLILPGRSVTFVDRSTNRGPTPPPSVREGETRGIDDYLAGHPYRPHGDPYGKPAHPELR